MVLAALARGVKWDSELWEGYLPHGAPMERIGTVLEGRCVMVAVKW